MSEGLRRLILTIKPDGHELRVLYRTASGSGPPTKPRRRRRPDVFARCVTP